MNKLISAVFAAVFACVLSSAAMAQQNAVVVDTCGTVTYDVNTVPKPLTIDKNGNLCSGGGTGSGGQVNSSMAVGQQKVATAGTQQQLIAASTPLKNGIVVCALTTNTGTGTVGLTGVNNTIDGTGNGYPLVAGQCMSIAISNANLIYLNGTANNTAFEFVGN